MVRLLSSVFHFKAESISVILTILSFRSKRFRTQRAALLWTISTVLVFLAVYGSHTDEQYSRVGRTRALYESDVLFFFFFFAFFAFVKSRYFIFKNRNIALPFTVSISIIHGLAREARPREARGVMGRRR